MALNSFELQQFGTAGVEGVNMYTIFVNKAVSSFEIDHLCVCVCSKIQRYSPTDSAKTFEKPVNRKAGIKFYPKQVLDLVRLGTQLPEPLSQSKRQLIEAYIDVSRDLHCVSKKVPTFKLSVTFVKS